MADRASDEDLPIADRAGPVPLAYAPLSLARPRRVLQWLVTAAVLVRMVYGSTLSANPAALMNLPDQVEYWQLARSILEGTGLRFDDVTMRQMIYAFRMPAYPLFVAACGAEVAVVRVVQAVLDGSCVLAVYLLTTRLRGPRAGVVAGLCVAVHPYLIFFSTLVLSETLFTAVLTWGVFLMLSPKGTARRVGVLLLIAGVFVRPSAIGLGVAAAGVLAWTGRRSWPRSVGGMIVAAVVLVCLLLPWAMRNRARIGRMIWTTTNSGYTAYDSFNPRADGSSNQKAFRQTLTDPAVAAAIRTDPNQPLLQWWRLHDRGEAGRNELFTELAWQYAREHPGRVATLAVAKLGRLWSPWPMSKDFGDWRYRVVGGAFVVPFFALVVVGVVRGGLGRRTTLTLLLPALYFSAVHCVFVGSLRYRVPCDAPLAVLAGAGAASVLRPKAGAR